MSDWDFLHEMRERGYSAKEIDEAAGCGVAPWEWAQIEEREGNCNRDLGKIRDAGSATREGSKGRRIRPSKEQIAQLPPFVGLALDRIFVVRTMSQLKVASDAIHSERFVGFDTESKPTWTEDAPRTGPHVIQLALSDRAYIFQKPS